MTLERDGLTLEARRRRTEELATMGRTVQYAVVYLAYSLAPCQSADYCGSGSTSPFIEKLRSAVPAECDEAERALGAARRDTIRSLLTIATSPVDGTRGEFAKYRAIRLLGEYRASEAANYLAREIGYSPRIAMVRRHDRLNSFPAASALVEIGAPGALAVLERLRQPLSDMELTLFAFVICGVDGKELGLSRLEIAFAEGSRAGGDLRTDNLRRLITLYRATDFRNPRMWPRQSENSGGENSRDRIHEE
jgi:hypothetical protein